MLAACRSKAAEEPAPAPSPTPAGAVASAARVTDARPKIVALGDSLTAGYGLSETQAYPALLQRVLRLRIQALRAR